MGLGASFKADWSQKDDYYDVHNHHYGEYDGVSGEFCPCSFGNVRDHDLTFDLIQFCLEKFFSTRFSGLPVFLSKLCRYIKFANSQRVQIERAVFWFVMKLGNSENFRTAALRTLGEAVKVYLFFSQFEAARCAVLLDVRFLEIFDPK